MKRKLIGIGGANADFIMHARAPVVLHDSNPGHFAMSAGGVMRNICENTARLGIPTTLIAAIGCDAPGELIRTACRGAGIDISHTVTLGDCPSSVYLTTLDDRGEMFVSFSDMAAATRLSAGDIDRNLPLFDSAGAVCMDANPTREFIAYAAKTLSARGVPLFLDPVSTAHCKKLGGLLGYFDTIKPNLLELGTLCGHTVENSDAALAAAADELIAQGVRRVFVSLGTGGVFCRERGGFACRLVPPTVPMQNANGAGDAFTAGLLSAYLDGLSVYDTLCRACACAALAVQSAETVNPQISPDTVEKAAENVKRNAIYTEGILK